MRRTRKIGKKRWATIGRGDVLETEKGKRRIVIMGPADVEFPTGPVTVMKMVRGKYYDHDHGCGMLRAIWRSDARGFRVLNLTPAEYREQISIERRRAKALGCPSLTRAFRAASAEFRRLATFNNGFARALCKGRPSRSYWPNRSSRRKNRGTT